MVTIYIDFEEKSKYERAAEIASSAAYFFVSGDSSFI